MSGESGYTKSSKGDSTQTVHGNRSWLVEGMASDTVLGMNSQTVVGLNSLAVAGLQQGLFVVGVQTVVLGGIDNMVWGWASDYASSWTEEHPVHVEKHGTRTVSVEGASTEEVVGVASVIAGEMNLSAESELAMTADTITRSGATLISDTTDGAYSNVAGASVIGADESMSLIGGGSNLQLVPGTAQINAPTVFINGELINLGQPPVPEDIAPVVEPPAVVVSDPEVAPVAPDGPEDPPAEEETGDDLADGAKNETPEEEEKPAGEQDTTVGEERGGEDAQTTAEDNPGSGAGGEEISIDLTDGSFHDDDDSLDPSSSDAATNHDSISTIATDDSGGTDSLGEEDDANDPSSGEDGGEEPTAGRPRSNAIDRNWVVDEDGTLSTTHYWDTDGNPVRVGGGVVRSAGSGVGLSSWAEYMAELLGDFLVGECVPGCFSFLGCWVAREVYGERDPRWLVFRSWLLSPDAPCWLRLVYIAHGEWFARWIHHRPLVKFVVRCLMDLVVVPRCREGATLHVESRSKKEMVRR